MINLCRKDLRIILLAVMGIDTEAMCFWLQRCKINMQMVQYARVLCIPYYR